MAEAQTDRAGTAPELTAHGYPITIRRLSAEEGGGYLAEVLDLPGCMSDGDSITEAIANVAEAVEVWIDGAREEGHPIPNPADIDHYSGKWVQRVPKSLHYALAQRAKAEGVSLNQLVLSLIARGLGRREGADERAA